MRVTVDETTWSRTHRTGPQPDHSWRGRRTAAELERLGAPLDRARSVAHRSTSAGRGWTRRSTRSTATSTMLALAGLDKVLIIHGMGTGAVRDTVRARSASHPLVTSIAARVSVARAATGRRSSSSDRARRERVSEGAGVFGLRVGNGLFVGPPNGGGVGRGMQGGSAADGTGVARTGRSSGGRVERALASVGSNGAPQLRPNGVNAPL